jgi:hypothetical protein
MTALGHLVEFLSKWCRGYQHDICAGSWTGLGLQARCSCACHHHNVTAATDSAHEKEVPETQ